MANPNERSNGPVKRRAPPDFAAINAAALGQLEAILERWLPNGRKVRQEWTLGSLAGEAGQSLKIHLNGGKRGLWKDFTTGDGGGDPISLIAAVEHISQGDAARKLAEFLGIDLTAPQPPKPKTKEQRKPADAPAWRALMPVPGDAPRRPAAHPRHGKPDAWHVYRDGAGLVLGYVARFEKNAKRQKKEFFWLVFANRGGRLEWLWQGFPEPRPLYGLDRLTEKPGAPVLMVEGEKAADAAADLLPGWACLTWPGGSKACGKADFTPLAGRSVLLWPDADKPGREAMAAVAELCRKAGVESVRSVNVAIFADLTPGCADADEPSLASHARELPQGWDAADALAEGWTKEHLALLIDRPEFFERPPTLTTAKASATDETTGGQGTADSRFLVNESGLFFREPQKDGDEPPRHRRIADPLRVVALARDPEGCGWSPVLEFRDMDGRTRQEIMPRRLFLGDGSDGIKQLADMGLFIEPGRKALDMLKEYVCRARPAKRARLLESLGWHGDVFLLPDGTIGQSDELLIYRGSRRALGLFTPRGSLTDWQANIAALAPGNPRLIFSLAAALTGPLIKPCGGPSFAIHWVGDSSEGKSGSLAASGSIWGNPSGVVHSWRSTDNSLEYVAAQHNDSLLILDELKEVDPKGAGAVVYMLSNSKGKNRAHHAGGLREGLSWRIVMLSSGELGLADHLATVGQKVHAGQSVRFIELGSNGGAGLGMWNELHGLAGGREFTDAMKSRAARFHGTAGRAFVAALIQRLADIPDTVKQVEERFFAEFVPPGAGGQVKRVAACFALVAAAGELGTKFGVLPWQPKTAFEAAGLLFREWVQGRPTAGNLEEAQIIAHVRRLMEKSWQARFVDWHRTTEENADISRMAAIQDPLGFRKKEVPFKKEEASYLFYVTRARFAEEFANKAGFQPKRVAKLLRDRGVLKCDSDASTLKERLPNGDPRSFCIIGRKLWEL